MVETLVQPGEEQEGQVDERLAVLLELVLERGVDCWRVVEQSYNLPIFLVKEVQSVRPPSEVDLLTRALLEVVLSNFVLADVEAVEDWEDHRQLEVVYCCPKADLGQWQVQQQQQLELELEAGQQDLPSVSSQELEMYPLQNQHHCWEDRTGNRYTEIVSGVTLFVLIRTL